MSAATPYLQRVSELLAGVLSLTEVIAERTSPAEWDFLLEVSSLTERVLPGEAAHDPSAALAFLLLVRFSLESTARALADPVEPT
jgi:hypothetical protein